ncbi:MAG: hypothetical protein MJ148_01290 [Clostridia bacterium]|nr:hypothetical protein [Clostridia bacterium]
MSTEVLIVTLSSLIYIAFMFGMLLFEFDNIELAFQRYRLRRKKKSAKDDGKLLILAKDLLSGALGRDVDGIWLVVAVVLIFVVSFIIALSNFSFYLAMVIAFFLSALPLLLLYSKMQALRNKGSQEGISLLTEMYRQYKMNSLNIFKAIELTIAAKGEYPICRKHLYVLLLRLQDAANADEIRRHCRALSFALGGNWGRSVASCIEIAASKGTDISLALLDILEQLKTAKALVEERKRLNSESMRMTLFLIPFLYIMTTCPVY